MTIALILASAACSGSSSSGSNGSGQQSIYGNWLYTDSAGTAGLGLTVKQDGTYEIAVLRLTSSKSGNAEIETGTFTQSGSTLHVTPKQWSCPGPDPVTNLTYSFNGSSLEIATNTGVLALQPNTAAPASQFQITIGCFDSAGAFTPEPLAPVMN